MATFYLVFISLMGIATLTALIPGRALGWWVPLWFLVSTATNELAVWGLILHLLMLAVGVTFFDPGDPFVRYALCVLMLSCVGTLILLKRHFETGGQLERALQIGLPPNFEEIIPHERRRRLSHQISAKDWLHPLRFARHGVKRERNIAYGEAGKRNLLDIFTPIRPGSDRPVLLQIHGGAWLVGKKEEQALPLMHHMALWVGWLWPLTTDCHLGPRFPNT